MVNFGWMILQKAILKLLNQTFLRLILTLQLLLLSLKLFQTHGLVHSLFMLTVVLLSEFLD